MDEERGSQVVKLSTLLLRMFVLLLYFCKKKFEGTIQLCTSVEPNRPEIAEQVLAAARTGNRYRYVLATKTIFKNFNTGVILKLFYI
eukprot:SAG31_NODE_3133_length_4638_cov_6.219432_2_plen_87_part_00